MTTAPGNASTPGSGHRSGQGASSSHNAWAAGGTTFAGVLMIVVGLFGIFEGISGIASDEVYQRLGSYVFKFDLTTWGWIHLIVGILVLVTGIAILGGKEWGRVLGIGLTALSMILHFMWLPWAPLWSIVAIAVGVFIIWALCNDKSEQLL